MPERDELKSTELTRNDTAKRTESCLPKIGQLHVQPEHERMGMRPTMLGSHLPPVPELA